jgi:hypothetical protein
MPSDTVPIVIASTSAAITLLVAVRGERERRRLQDSRLRTELRTEFMAEEAIRALLMHDRWRKRNFTEIKRRIRGFDDNALRQLLVRSGAVAFTGRNDEELWGLRERNPQDL